MQITHFERARFKVLCHGQEFLVDVLVYRGAGFCDCFHYLKHLRRENEANYLRADWKPTDANRCPHIRACREWLADLFFESLARQFPDNDLEP